jgi:hypothetical protein
VGLMSLRELDPSALADEADLVYVNDAILDRYHPQWREICDGTKLRLSDLRVAEIVSACHEMGGQGAM